MSKIEIPPDVMRAADAAEKVRTRNKEEAEQRALETTKKTQVAAAILAGLPGQPDGAPGSNLQADVMAAILESLRGDIEDRERKRNAEKEERERQLKAMHNNIAHEKAQRDAIQNYCPHMKEGGKGPSIGGQRHYDGRIGYICEKCFKQWTDLTLPAHLHIPMEFVGG